MYIYTYIYYIYSDIYIRDIKSVDWIKPFHGFR